MTSKVLLLTPPFTQLNTPYPATAYLKGFLNTKHIESHQADLGIEVILDLFSKRGLTDFFAKLDTLDLELGENTYRIYNLRQDYIQTIDPVIRFLQNKNPTLAHSICDRTFLPEAARFKEIENLEWAFGTMGLQDKARHFATLYLEDLGDLIKETIDPHFGFSRYAERLGRTATHFDELQASLIAPNSIVSDILVKLLDEKIQLWQPTVVCLSAPFPGNLFGALKCGQFIKQQYPHIKVVLGGGYANTELRSLNEARVFDYIDYVCLDDGEAALYYLLEYLEGLTPKSPEGDLNTEYILTLPSAPADKSPKERVIQHTHTVQIPDRNLNVNTQVSFRAKENLKRVFMRDNGKVVYMNGAKETDIAQKDTGTPDYSDLPLDDYISVIEIANPMHRLWSDGRWNKLTLAHGCYWGKCSFCDISLDYIRKYEPLTASLICDRMEEIIAQTYQNGFHFVDEAAPPNLLRELALEIIRRKLIVTWWTNIRFEKLFTPDLSLLLKASGCIAVAGGLEVASDRLLAMMKKGVTVAQVAQVADGFTKAGIMVHAYLMYGFPTQTEQETIDALEMVRQLFETGVLQSGFWHRFAMTAHSPVGLEPAKFEVEKVGPDFGGFADNDLYHEDPKGGDHDLFAEGLRKSLFNYMHGMCLDFPLQEWFDHEVPETSIPVGYIDQCLDDGLRQIHKQNAVVVWLGNVPEMTLFEAKKGGKKIEMSELEFYDKKKDWSLQTTGVIGEWIAEIMPRLVIAKQAPMPYKELVTSFESKTGGKFEDFARSREWFELRENGMLIL
jgi:radical SAM superfamily enzyme YgiQ (UPF0313 family)